ncbi:uncharacterized protein LAJ45_03207 [Morchella importuna]|uniref:uncharacterized protein n=1 Tax=Morchella importuna TaxID=1174673 RepID=UPI001E8D5AF4|nr:uncharacterized protein LAJ45_03207 [Morchella importuna]KAH8152980.1 hypothetical protein LAJ45_03207 [Morchella importuna]
MAPYIISTVQRLDAPSTYFEKRDHKRQRREDSPKEDPLAGATTLYVGNLSFYTTEEQIHELFSKCGEIKRLVMGLDRFNAMKYIGGTKLDERIIRTDLDPGFKEGRQYGRGPTGGQVRDYYREDYDPGRGGYGGREQRPASTAKGSN